MYLQLGKARFNVNSTEEYSARELIEGCQIRSTLDPL